MIRQRATVSEKKRRRAYVLRMIGEGWGLSELTTHVQDSWGLSRAQARRYVKDAHTEFVNDYEVEDSGLLFACIDKLERVARTSMEKGQYSNTIGAIKLLQELLLALRANDAEGFKGWLALGLEELGRQVVIELMQDWMSPLLTEKE